MKSALGRLPRVSARLGWTTPLPHRSGVCAFFGCAVGWCGFIARLSVRVDHDVGPVPVAQSLGRVDLTQPAELQQMSPRGASGTESDGKGVGDPRIFQANITDRATRLVALVHGSPALTQR